MSISRRLFTGGLLGAGALGGKAVEAVAKNAIGGLGGQMPAMAGEAATKAYATDSVSDSAYQAANKEFRLWRKENEPREAHNLNGYALDILSMRSWSDSYKHMRNRSRIEERRTVFGRRVREFAESSPIMKQIVPRWMYEDDSY